MRDGCARSRPASHVRLHARHASESAMRRTHTTHGRVRGKCAPTFRIQQPSQLPRRDARGSGERTRSKRRGELLSVINNGSSGLPERREDMSARGDESDVQREGRSAAGMGRVLRGSRMTRTLVKYPRPQELEALAWRAGCDASTPNRSECWAKMPTLLLTAPLEGPRSCLWCPFCP